MLMEIKKLKEDAIEPFYKTEGSVAFDVSAIEEYTIEPDCTRSKFLISPVTMVHTGLAIDIPDGYEVNVRARSGLSLKYPNYIAISGGGTIDSDYRGEIIIPIINNTNRVWVIERGDRIAQCVVSPILRVEFMFVDELSKTERGSGGFGHTGR